GPSEENRALVVTRRCEAIQVPVSIQIGETNVGGEGEWIPLASTRWTIGGASGRRRTVLGVEQLCGAEQLVCGLEQLAAQARGQLRVRIEELANGGGDGGRAVPAERGIEPALGEEDVAGPADLLEQLETQIGRAHV